MDIQIEIKDDHELIVLFPYSEKRVKRVRLIDGRHWNAEHRQWLIPFTLKAISQVRIVFREESISWGKGVL